MRYAFSTPSLMTTETARVPWHVAWFLVLAMVLQGGVTSVEAPLGLFLGLKHFGIQNSTIVLVLWGAMYVYAAAFCLNARTIAMLWRSPLSWAVTLMPLLTFIWSEDRSATLLQSLAVIGTFVIAVFAAQRLSLQQFLRLLCIATLVTLILSLFLALVPGSPGITPDGMYRGAWRGAYIHKNMFAARLAFGAAAFMFAYFVLAPRWRWLNLLGFVACALLMVPVHSATGSVLLLIACGLVAVLYLDYRLPAQRWVLVSFILMIGMLVISWLLSGIIDFAAITELFGRNDTLTGRTEIWDVLWRFVLEKFWLGYGYGAFWEEGFGALILVQDFLGYLPPHAHNGLLEMMLDTGLIGTALFLVLFGHFAYLAARPLWKGAAWKGAERRNAGQDTGFLALLPLVVLALFTLLNAVARTILVYNNLYWFLFVVVYFWINRPWVSASGAPAKEPLQNADNPRNSA